ncbi:MAG: hypothetical protein V2A53_05425 [bacterium]
MNSFILQARNFRALSIDKPKRTRELMGVDVVIVYYKNNFAIFDLIDYQAIL